MPAGILSRALRARLNKRTHRVEVTGVAGGSTIHYQIVSGGTPDPYGPYQVTIQSVPLSAAPVGITGSVPYDDGSPGRECLVYVAVEQLFFGQVLRSLPINVLTNGGSYAADIKNIRLAGLPDQPLSFDPNSDNATIFVTAACDPANQGTVSKTTAEADKLTVGVTVSEYQNMDVTVGAVGAQPTLSIADVTVAESAGIASVTITLDPAAGVDVTVDYAIADGTAVAPADYTAASGTATIAVGLTSATVAVFIIDDTLPEGAETFTVTLTNPTGGAVISATAGTATVIIVDDEGAPVLSVADVTVAENSGTASVTITLDPAAGGDVTVKYFTANGTAWAGPDYVNTVSTATIAAGQTSTTVTLLILDDVVEEGTETFAVSLSSPTGGAVISAAAGTATVTIQDNDKVLVFDPDRDVQLNAAGMVVTWVTGADEDGVVEWALSATDLATSPNTATDSRGPLANRANKRTHRVEITGVAGGSTIHYRIVSGGVPDPNGPYQVTIPSVPLSAAPVGITGIVTYEDGSPGRECQVYIVVKHLFFGIELSSLPINVLTNGGSYAADIKNIRLDGSPDQPLAFGANSEDSTIFVTAVCDPATRGTIAKTTAQADKLIVGTTVSEYQNMDVGLGVVSTLSITGVTVGEDTPSATLTITLDPASGVEVTVDYATADGTATAGADYTAASGTATIAAGQTSATITVPIIDDSLFEADETFTVTLSNPTGGAVISPTAGAATVAILENESPLAIVPVDVQLLAGFNLIGIPVQFETEMKARDLAEALLPAGTAIGDGPVISVLGWNASSQAVQHDKMAAGMVERVVVHPVPSPVQAKRFGCGGVADVMVTGRPVHRDIGVELGGDALELGKLGLVVAVVDHVPAHDNEVGLEAVGFRYGFLVERGLVGKADDLWGGPDLQAHLPDLVVRGLGQPAACRKHPELRVGHLDAAKPHCRVYRLAHFHQLLEGTDVVGERPPQWLRLVWDTSAR